MNNVLEVFCTSVKPSKNNFRAYVQEAVSRSPGHRARETEVDGTTVDPRAKVEDDLDIGGDLLKISQRRNFEEIDEEIRDRGSNGSHDVALDVESIFGSDQQVHTVRPEEQHLSWVTRSVGLEILPEVAIENPSNARK